MPLNWRIGNALVSYLLSISAKCFGRRTCLVLSISPESISVVAGCARCRLILLISGLAILWRKTNPWFFTGWFWYLGMLAAGDRFVQVGAQSAGRLHLPAREIGLAIALIWA